VLNAPHANPCEREREGGEGGREGGRAEAGVGYETGDKQAPLDSNTPANEEEEEEEKACECESCRELQLLAASTST